MESHPGKAVMANQKKKRPLFITIISFVGGVLLYDDRPEIRSP